MSGSPPDRATVRLPVGLLGMLALIVAVEAAIAGLRADLISPLLEDWHIAARAAGTKAPGCDVLCFGDSLVKYGVLPRVIRRRAGLRAYNLATSGGTMPSSYFLFRRALDAGARPRAVVVDFAALMLADSGPPKLLNYSELGTVRDCLDLAWTARDAGFFASSALGKLLPSFRWRFEIRQGVRAALDGRSTSTRGALASLSTLWEREAGAQPFQAPRVHHPEEAFLVDGVSPREWACDPGDRAYLERFLTLAESRGIAVYWLLPPFAPEVHEMRASRGSDAAYAQFVRSIQTRHPATVVLDARRSGYDNSVHLDHLHLDHRGASVLSGDLAAVLADRPLGGGWVDLPAFAGRTGDEPTPALAGSRPSTTR